MTSLGGFYYIIYDVVSTWKQVCVFFYENGDYYVKLKNDDRKKYATIPSRINLLLKVDWQD